MPEMVLNKYVCLLLMKIFWNISKKITLFCNNHYSKFYLLLIYV